MALIFQAQSSWSLLSPGPAAAMIPQSCPHPFFLLYCILLCHYQVSLFTLLTLVTSSGLKTCRYNCLWAAFRCLTVSLRSKPGSPAPLASTCSASNIPSSSLPTPSTHLFKLESWKLSWTPPSPSPPHPTANPQQALVVLLELPCICHLSPCPLPHSRPPLALTWTLRPPPKLVSLQFLFLPHFI